MVKNRIEYRIGEFIDFAGRTRKYIVAAVSELVDDACVTTLIQDTILTKIQTKRRKIFK